VAGAIQKELADLIVNELDDPRVDGVTITDVRVVRDLRHATIYVSRLDEAQYAPGGLPEPTMADREPARPAKRGKKAVPDENSPHAYVEVLNRAAGLLRRHIGRRLSMKITPQLHFEYDETLARSYRISKLIEDEAKPVDDADDPSADHTSG